jgi:hypothetical protein
MVRREIDLDEESDRILSELAEEYEGDAGKALADLLQARGGVEAFADACEEAQRDLLLAQKGRSEREFRDGRVVSWEEVKRRNRL